MPEFSISEKVSKPFTKAFSKKGLKRLIDRFLSFPFFLLSLPVVGISAVIIKVVSPGPAFYSQHRVGYKGETINILKLRTMHVDSEQLLKQHLESNSAAQEEWSQFYKLKNDPRVIPYVGNFFRKTSIDELPQLWNVFRGDMSLVGPRPFPQYHLDAFPEDFQQYRQQVVPGLTGLWQISARSEGDITAQQTLDTQYIQQQSTLVDIKIIFITIKVVLLQKGAC